MPTTQFSVADRTAIVTGGSSSIGQTIARRFVADDANVVICSREQDRVDSVAASLADSDGEVHPVECDVRNRAAVDALVDATVKTFDGVGILVNNAGADFCSEFDDSIENSWETIININLTGTVNCLQAASKELRAGDGGAVVNLSSFVTHFSSHKQSHYGAAKASVSHLTGMVDRQVGYPEEIADLVSPASSYMTGEVVDIRGVPQGLNLDDRFPRARDGSRRSLSFVLGVTTFPHRGHRLLVFGVVHTLPLVVDSSLTVVLERGTGPDESVRALNRDRGLVRHRLDELPCGLDDIVCDAAH